MKYRNNFLLHEEFNFTHLHWPDPWVELHLVFGGNHATHMLGRSVWVWCVTLSRCKRTLEFLWFIFVSNPGSHFFMFVMISFTVNLSIHFTSFIHFNFSTEVKHYLLIARGSIKWKNKDLRSVYPQRKFQVSGCWLLMELRVNSGWELHENKKLLSDQL